MLFVHHTAPGDYTTLVTELTFTADDGIGSVQCVNVTIIDDEILEPDQSFTVSLSSSDPVVFGIDQASIVIGDNDGKKY